MCTVSWCRCPGGYDLYFNRDERRTRKPARPPAVQGLGAAQFVAPTDTDAGGTWLAVNDKGLTLGVLNHYPAEPSAPRGRISRGRLVTSLIDAATSAAAASRLRAANLGDYSPFFLLALDPTSAATLHAWDGVQLSSNEVADDAVPVSTSSFDPEIVVAQRRARFASMRGEQGAVDAALLRRYHASREERGDAYSVFMSRPDAQTVSISHVHVGADVVQFAYWPREAVEAGVVEGKPVALARA